MVGLAGFGGSAVRAAPQKGDRSSSGFDHIVQPFIAKNCYSCHNGKSAAGGLNLQTLNSPSTLSVNRDEWEKIASRIGSGNMPPKVMPRPDAADVNAVTTWLRHEFERMDRDARPNPGGLAPDA
ncbi:MAG: hypothetical protein KGN84_13885 [Acidobacteriota bacterium]|nr:hypothetical protein [Acidobacteriota bacterium]